MRIQLFCFNLLLMISSEVYSAAPKKGSPAVLRDFTKLAGQPDEVLKKIAAQLSDADLARFGEVSHPFHIIAQMEFEIRPSYLWAKGEISEKSFKAHQGAILSVFVTNDARIVSVGQNDRLICKWQQDGNTYKKIKQITDDGNSPVKDAFFSATANRLVLFRMNNDINVWDMQEGKKINEFNVGSDKNPALSPDGTMLAASTYGRIHLWNLTTGKSKEINTLLPGRFRQLTYSPDGTKLAFYDGLLDPIILWDLETNTKKEFDVVPHPILSFLSGKLITYTVINNNQILMRDVQTGNKISDFWAGEYNIYATSANIRFSHNGTLGAVADSNKIILWHIQSGNGIRKLKTNSINAFTFSPADKMIVAGCFNGDVVTWKATLPEKKEAKSIKKIIMLTLLAADNT